MSSSTDTTPAENSSRLEELLDGSGSDPSAPFTLLLDQTPPLVSKTGDSPSPTQRKGGTWTRDRIAALKPGPTMSFRMSDLSHRRMLAAWLRHLDTLGGMNLPFDIQYLRAIDPLFRLALSGSHTILDLSYINYLHSEVRPERSLKTIGPLLGAYKYAEDIKSKYESGFETMADVDALCRDDTHNSLLAISELARRIQKDFPATDKLSPYCIHFYSRTFWSCIRMAEAGIPMSVPALTSLETHLLSRCARVALLTKSRNLLLEGKGSQLSKDALLRTVVDTIDAASPLSSSVLNHPLLTLTEKQRKLSWSEENRNLLASLLPPRAPLRRLLSIVRRHSHSQKIVSSYTYPLLHHRRTLPSDRSSVLVPQHSVFLPPPVVQEFSPCLTSPSDSLAVLEATSSATSSCPPKSSLASSNTTGVTKRASNTATSSETALWSSTDIGTSLAVSRKSWTEKVWLAHPTWYPVPTPEKDTSGAEGGTQQSRIVCKRPSAQTFPPPVQDCIVSRWEGGLIISSDASQAELRAAALLSNDPGMVAEYLKPKPDLHTTRAIEIFSELFLIKKYGDNFRKDEVFYKDSRSERQCGKTVNFGDLFRAGAETLQKSVLEKTGVLYSTSIFENIVRTRAFARPGLWAWQESLIASARRDGYLCLPFIGQSRFFLGGTKYDVNEIVNFPVQATASNALLALQHYMHSALPPLNDPLGDIHMFLNIYDSLKFDCKTPAAASRCLTLLREGVTHLTTSGYWSMLENHLNRHVPFVMEYDAPAALLTP